MASRRQIYKYSKQNLGNPLLVASAANMVKEGITEKAPAIARGIKTTLGLFGTGLLVYFGYKGVKKWNQNRVMRQSATDENVRAAMDIYSAIPAGLKKSEGGFLNPFGLISDALNQIERIWTSTDTERILTIAKRITDPQKVFKSFQTIYGEDLYTLLSKALKKEELDVFMNITQRGSFSRTNKPAAGLVIYTSKAVTVRKTAEVNDGYVFNNKVAHVPAGKILGISTGVELNDEKNNAVFIEFKAVSGGSSEFKNILYAWKGALKFYSFPELEAALGPKVKAFQKYLYRFDPDDLSGFDNVPETIGSSKLIFSRTPVTNDFIS